MVKVGIIGGSGLSSNSFFDGAVEKKKVHTPYGAPSDLVTIGKIGNVEVFVIPRHGSSHQIQPSHVNFRANIWALKELGVSVIFAPTAVGSLREEIKPGDLVFPDQFIDRTTKRTQTLYDGQVICHIGMADPFCQRLRERLVSAAKVLQLEHHAKGTVVTIEGPRFSSRAESHMFRSWGADIINMTTVPEVVLAREAGICYAAIAMSTDYDCWHDSKEPVTLDMVLATMKDNAERVTRLLKKVIPELHEEECSCHEASKSALL